MTANRRPVRAALAAGIAFGAAYLVAVPFLRPEQVGVATDVYFLAARTLLDGGNPYLVEPVAHPGFRFLYPPLVALAFVPHALAGSQLGAFALQTLINLGAAGVLAWLLVSTVEDAGVALDGRDRLLVAGFVFASVHSVSVFVMGQVNLLLALALAAGAVLVERDRQPAAGVAVALAATVKLFPAVVGAWLLRRRAWRAVAAAAATGLALLVAGVLLLGPSLTATFLTDVVPAERHAAEFAGGLPPTAMYVTVRRPLAALFPAVDPTSLALVALALLVPVVVAASWDVSGREGRMVALLATVLSALLVLPLEPFYFSLLYYPLVPLLYLLDPGRVRRLFVAGTVLLSAVVSYQAVVGVLAVVPLSPGVEMALAGAARAAFRVAQPPLLGALLLLAGCVLFQYESSDERPAADDVADTALE